MYSLTAYGRMIADPIRRRAYAEALERAVRPGCTVLDLGTGPGVFALLAARLGARRVYAVESDDSIDVARQMAAAHGLGDRIRFFHGLSTEIEVPERVDVVISDLRSTLPLYRRHLPSVIDARERWLKDGGTLIPREDRLWIAVIEAPEPYAEHVGSWADNELGLDFSIPREMVSHTPTGVWMTRADQCLVEPRCWAVLDYRTVEATDARAHLEWQVGRRGRAHGLLLWFDATLAGEIGFSNAPGQTPLVYRQRFFPFPRPVELEAGDLVDVRITAVLVGGDYVWRWRTAIDRPAAEPVRFDQSTFQGSCLSAARLHQRAADHVPKLDPEARIVAFVLAHVDGRRSLETIARELQAAFPERFADWRAALDRVGDLAATYGG